MKQRPITFPELEKHIINYIFSSEEVLSEYDIRILWNIVTSKAKVIGSELVKVGTMTHQQIDSFQFSNGLIHSFQRCNNLLGCTVQCM